MVRPVRRVCVESRKSVIRVTTSKAAHGYRSTLEKTVKVAVREFFDSDAGKTRHERQATATKPNASRIPLVRTYMLSVAPLSDYRCGMTNGLSLGTKPRLLGLQCSLHSVNGCHP